LYPNQVKATRDRFCASGGKSDRFDCLCCASSHGLTPTAFRILEPDSDETRALRALVRAREDLVAAKVALANRSARRAGAVLAWADRTV